MIYVHVPFCRSFCTYCDFYSEIACKGKDGDAVNRWMVSLKEEIQARRHEAEAASETDTLYIGGGTPSVLPPSCIEEIVSELGGGPWTEFTVEVNPEDIVEKGLPYARRLKEAGVNRISMGVQSLDDGILRWMNRRHDSAHAAQAFGILREAGFENISLDVIFGISQLDDGTLENTLAEILSWRPEHLSAYQLGIEEGSALADMLADGRYEEASDEQCRRQYGMICRKLKEAGYDHYEISNWALPGKKAIHNSAYWERKPYLGLGPGAHSFDGKSRSWNSRSAAGWTRQGEVLGDDEAREESIMLGLRTAEGIDPALCDRSVADRMVSEGLLEYTEGRIRIPETEFFVSDTIIAELV